MRKNNDGILQPALAAGALALTLLAGVPAAHAISVEVRVKLLTADGSIGDSIGTVTFQDTVGGVLIVPNLKGLPPGVHGFHIHTKPTCMASKKDGKTVPGGAAGSHYDPKKTKRHEGPYGDGHLGDLPSLVVNKSGQAVRPLFAPRIKVSNIRTRALIIHAEGDNYADTPKKLGGGGARIACGVIN